MKIELETGKLLGFRLYSGAIGAKVGGKDGEKDQVLLSAKVGSKTEEGNAGVKDESRAS
ncbi:MAG: hypothetical protein RID91_13595 [Azospirillaceae bacterium]